MQSMGFHWETRLELESFLEVFTICQVSIGDVEVFI
jgi:hypothetical protein